MGVLERVLKGYFVGEIKNNPDYELSISKLVSKFSDRHRTFLKTMTLTGIVVGAAYFADGNVYRGAASLTVSAVPALMHPPGKRGWKDFGFY